MQANGHLGGLAAWNHQYEFEHYHDYNHHDSPEWHCCPQARPPVMTVILPQVLQVALSRGVQVAVLVVGVAGGGLEIAIVAAPAITVTCINTALET